MRRPLVERRSRRTLGKWLLVGVQPFDVLQAAVLEVLFADVAVALPDDRQAPPEHESTGAG